MNKRPEIRRSDPQNLAYSISRETIDFSEHDREPHPIRKADNGLAEGLMILLLVQLRGGQRARVSCSVRPLIVEPALISHVSSPGSDLIDHLEPQDPDQPGPFA